ncbi:winged helix-turn-helix transcriptional regulator [Romboutsia lituseburensis]|uniref:winged helix-turn-helix transcriptional regulator n=1 Tax=Romboutsia lituseburensis TaxID=1537 RepID=UPI00215A482D|nr:helix-turn-helix transcriptional regulator [Romboutsia lituseburensis]MCR8746320.1 helix-turn-helix transcriptional regulator [Romboutsia lituseburensis]
MISYKEKNYVCLLDLAMEMIRGKLKAVIIYHLNKGEKRFLGLQRITYGVNQKALTEKLKELEEDKLITKVIYPEVPPRVEYFLTDMGKYLAIVLESLEDWSSKYFSHLK